MFKLIHEHYPKFIKIFKVFLNSTSFKKKPNIELLAELDINVIGSKCFVIIFSNIIKSEKDDLKFSTLAVELGKNLRIYYARKNITENILFKKELVNIEDSDNVSLNIGEILINIFIEASELMKIENKRISAEYTDVVLIPTKDLVSLSIELGYVKDLLLPMLINPFPWEIKSEQLVVDGASIDKGMYLFNTRIDKHQPITLIKKSKDNYGRTLVPKKFVEQINRIASIPFRINKKVLFEIEKLLYYIIKNF